MDSLPLFSELPIKQFAAGLCIGYAVGLLFYYKLKINNGEKTVEKSDSGVLPNKPSTHSVALVVNSSLKMGKGKVAAQCGHAILSLCKKAKKNSKETFWKWVQEGQDIQIVSVKSTEDFNDLSEIASMESLNCYIVADAGRTQIKSGSLTVMGIGPAHNDVISGIIGQLPIYL